MPDMDGLELQQELIKRQSLLRVIVITGHGDVPLAVQAMKAGAVDFLEKPFAHDVLVASIKRALDESAKAAWSAGAADEVENRLNLLTKREREVFAGVVAGKMSKTIAYELGSSVRTVEIHRARMMNKMQASNMQELIRMALALKKQ
jgi:two-component system response regulator FixJ